MTKRYQFFHAGLMQHKARRAERTGTLMAAAKDSHDSIGMAGHADASSAYYESGYGLPEACSAGYACFACDGPRLDSSAASAHAARCPVNLYTCMFMMS
jgi:hypothetical protein